VSLIYSCKILSVGTIQHLDSSFLVEWPDMKTNKKVIWEQVLPKDAEFRIQQAFEMLLGDEFGLTNCAQQETTVDQRFWEEVYL